MLKYFFLIILCSVISFSQRDVKDFAIHLTAKIDSSNNYKIELNWQHDPQAIYYTVYRKGLNDKKFELVHEIDDNVDSFVDSSINFQKDRIYEYKVDKYGEWLNPNSNKEEDFMGWGYISVGIEYQQKQIFDKILLLVDEFIYGQLESEINAFKKDLIADRWDVLIKTVPREENFDFEKVSQTKELVLNVYETNPDLRTILVLGRVPIPFSGFYTPDGHAPDNRGAWPCDSYYADVDGIWSDDTISAFVPNFEWHTNTKGDGKFDNNFIPSDIEFEIARIDFFDLPFFEDDEITLFRKYFQKNSEQRHGRIDHPKEAIIDDGFEFAHNEMFASSPWMNFSAILGRESISYNIGMRSVLQERKFMLTSAIASGAISNIYLRAYAPDYAENNQYGIIGQFFGSYAIEWFTTNNMLRSALASQPSFLASYWGCRPYWYLHHMGLGKTIGYSYKLSHNNEGLYESNQDEDHLRQVHVTLQGDPTLRLFRNPPPQNVVAFYNPNAEPDRVRISWDRNSPNEKYFVYYSEHLDSTFRRLNTFPINDNEFFHFGVEQEAGHWFVSSLLLENVNSGSFWNESIGSWADVVSSIDEILFESYYDRFTNKLITDFKTGNEIRIFNSLGIEVVQGEVDSHGEFQINQNLPPGPYFIKSVNGAKHQFSKFMISL